MNADLNGPSIAVTGATGVVGSGVAQRLAELGIAQRLVVRSPGRVHQIPGAQVAAASYDDPAAAAAALAGIQTVFMVSGAEAPNRLADHLCFVDAAARAGVRRIVYTSFYGASPDSTFLLARDHWHTEQYIRASGMAFTFLRNNLYADLLPDMAGPEGVLRGPAGAGRVAAVARADVIDAVVVILAAAGREPAAHDGATYALTGPAALTMAEIAAIITRTTGHSVSYIDETVREAYASRAAYGAPDWQVDAWVSTYTAIAAGELDGVSDDVRRLTSHPPLSLADLLGDGTER